MSRLTDYQILEMIIEIRPRMTPLVANRAIPLAKAYASAYRTTIEDGIHRIDGFDEAVLNREPFDYDLAAWNAEKYVGPVNRHPMKNRKQPRRC